MKTLVRVQEFDNGNYNKKVIQILEKPFINSDYVNAISGEITFQQTKGESEWYAMSFVYNGSNPGHIARVSRLTKKILDKLGYSPNPDEVLELIGAVEYKLFDNSFVLVKDVGKKFFNVMNKKNGGIHSHIIADDEKKAQSKLKKSIEKGDVMSDCELELKGTIIFS
jgi:hypothetical protein